MYSDLSAYPFAIVANEMLMRERELFKCLSIVRRSTSWFIQVSHCGNASEDRSLLGYLKGHCMY